MKRRLLFVLFLLSVLPGAPALAKKHKGPKKLGPVVTVTAVGKQATGDGAASGANAICPRGKQVVGGGFSSPLLNGSAVIVTDSYMSSPRSWTVRGQVEDGSGAVTAYAYCRRTKGHPITAVRAGVDFSADGETHTLTLTCPAGKLISGGFAGSAIPGSGSVVFPEVSQATSARTWTVTLVAHDNGPQHAVAAANCMQKIGAPKLVSTTTSATIGIFGSISRTTPACPKKGKKRKLLSAGGFATSPVNGSPGAPIMVFGDSRIAAGGGWLASATNAISSSAGVLVTSQAICL